MAYMLSNTCPTLILLQCAIRMLTRCGEVWSAVTWGEDGGDSLSSDFSVDECNKLSTMSLLNLLVASTTRDSGLDSSSLPVGLEIMSLRHRFSLASNMVK